MHGLKYLEFDGEKEFTNDNDVIYYGLSLTQLLAYAEIEVDKTTSVETKFATAVMLKLVV